MTDFVELHLKPELRERYALPNIGYPVPITRLMELLADDHNLDLAELLFWLQQRSGSAARDFRRYEPAMARLAQLLTPADDLSESASVQGDEWWLELGPVDLDGELVTIQRDDELVAAIAPRADGRLRVAVYRPLDASSAASLMNLSRHPDEDGKVNLRDNNWEYAKDASAGMGQVYTAEAGTSYLSYWQFGLGILHDRTESPVFHPCRTLTQRRPAEVATELGLHNQLADRSFR
jgi:antitoxin (DNA-binding transcriptional repressor) of toxin-antitoxin stability system